MFRYLFLPADGTFRYLFLPGAGTLLVEVGVLVPDTFGSGRGGAPPGNSLHGVMTISMRSWASRLADERGTDVDASFLEAD